MGPGKEVVSIHLVIVWLRAERMFQETFGIGAAIPVRRRPAARAARQIPF